MKLLRMTIGNVGLAAGGLLATASVASAQEHAVVEEAAAADSTIALLVTDDAPDVLCDESYPDICIPSPPPDIDCADVPERGFRAVGDDPHRLDRDHDGIACEGG